MRKALTLILVALCLISCGSALDKAATVNIKVLKNGQPVTNEMVYMFDSNLTSNSIHADDKVPTDEDGIATFDIHGIDFGVDNRITLTFETFRGTTEITGKVAVTAKRGETSSATIIQE